MIQQIIITIIKKKMKKKKKKMKTKTKMKKNKMKMKMILLKMMMLLVKILKIWLNGKKTKLSRVSFFIHIIFLKGYGCSKCLAR
jgi:hypothetical protein